MQQTDISFYTPEDVVSLAGKLLGKILLTETQGLITSGIIVETEAYRGPDDKGCHAYGGRYTERTKTMYLQGGHAYVYICYGVHPMVNVVTGPEGNAHAVLIRAIQPIQGIEIMLKRRNMATVQHSLTNGPGKLTVALGITKDMDSMLFYDEESPVKIMENTSVFESGDIMAGPRIGMSRHVGPCAHRPWRFFLKNNPWVSKPLLVKYPDNW